MLISSWFVACGFLPHNIWTWLRPDKVFWSDVWNTLALQLTSEFLFLGGWLAMARSDSAPEQCGVGSGTPQQPEISEREAAAAVPPAAPGHPAAEAGLRWGLGGIAQRVRAGAAHRVGAPAQLAGSASWAQTHKDSRAALSEDSPVVCVLLPPDNGGWQQGGWYKCSEPAEGRWPAGGARLL